MTKKPKIKLDAKFHRLVDKAFEEAAKKNIEQPKPWFSPKTIFQGVVSGIFVIVLFWLLQPLVLHFLQ